MSVHAATDDELIALTWFAGSGESIEASVQNGQDVLANWTILGVHPRGSAFRVYLFERSVDAVACVDGDGRSFGAVSSPSSREEWSEFLSHHDVHV